MAVETGAERLKHIRLVDIEHRRGKGLRIELNEAFASIDRIPARTMWSLSAPVNS